MAEAKALQTARDHLAHAETEFSTPNGLFHLEEGLALLDELCETAPTAQRDVAANLATTYAGKIFGRVRTAIQTDRAIPQPQLEHFFKLMLAFDTGDFTLPAESHALKIAVVRRLIDLCYEGYPEDKKLAVLEQLTQLRDRTAE